MERSILTSLDQTRRLAKSLPRQEVVSPRPSRFKLYLSVPRTRARSTMQSYDVGMLAVLALATLWGAWKGMAWQIASLASLVASYFVALRFSPSLAPYISRQEPWNRFLAMLLLYLLTSLVIWMSFRTVKRAINRVQLKEFDRQLGGLFGAAKGVLLCVAITFFAVSLSATGREVVLKSRSGYYVAVLLQRADEIMPKELHQVLDPYIEQLERRLEPR